MKLNSALVQCTLTQFDAQAIPDNHPVVQELNSLFGEHTFFLDTKGLNIVEPTDANDSGAQTAQVVNLARWVDAKRSSLVPHGPEATGVTVVLRSEGPDNATRS